MAEAAAATGPDFAEGVASSDVADGAMLAGRVGPLTLGSALILRDRRILYEFPRERPVVG